MTAASLWWHLHLLPPGQFHFEQPKMWHHLWKCFGNRKIDMFPYNKLRATELTVKSIEEVLVFRICRMPELPNARWKSAQDARSGFIKRCVFVFHPKPLLPKPHGFVVSMNSVQSPACKVIITLPIKGYVHVHSTQPFMCMVFRNYNIAHENGYNCTIEAIMPFTSATISKLYKKVNGLL